MKNIFENISTEEIAPAIVENYAHKGHAIKLNPKVIWMENWNPNHRPDLPDYNL